MKKLYKNLLRLVIVMGVMALGTVSYAQISISGTVLDDTNQAIPGVNILEKGTTNGTTTDAQGKYVINVSNGDAVLTFTFIGYATQDVSVTNRTVIDVSLAADATALQEVIVTGYTSERKADIVAAVSTISNKNTVAIPVSNVEQAIQGRVAGVQVITSGQPGATSQVRIRGFGGFANNGPLYIVDGVPTTNVDNLNPNDIESTTILKDAGAASIYGARAAAGVIVYTTRHGSNDGKMRVTYDMSMGLNFPGKGIDILDPQQTANKTWEAFRNSGQTPKHPQYGSGANPVLPDYINVGVQDKDGNWSAQGGIMEGDSKIAAATAAYNVDFDKGAIIQVVKANKAGTDWYGEMTRVAPVQRHSIGLSGGNDRSHYYIGLGYYNQQGIVMNQFLKRYTMRINSEFKVARGVRIGQNMQITYRDSPQIGDQQNENQLNFAYRMNPIIPVHDEFGGWAGTQAPGLNNPANPVANLTRQGSDYNKSQSLGFFGNLYAEADLMKNLTFRSSIGGTYGNSNFQFYTFRTYENSENNGAYRIDESAGNFKNWVFTNTLRYDKKFGNHSLKLLAGYEAVKTGMGRGISGYGLNPFTNDPNYISISNTPTLGRSVDSGAGTPSTLASIFGKLDYSLNDKYYISATVRRDGSSRFGSNNRTGVFPAITGAWRISSEDFMPKGSWLNDLKIRAGWGVMGNQNIIPTNQYTLYSGSPSTGYDITGANGSVTSGIRQNQVGNLSGKWEKNITTNIGLDGTFMNGTLDIIVDVWHKKTTELLFTPEVPATGGVYPQNPTINIASMVNKGIDLQIIKKVNVNSDLNLLIDANISPYKNEITSLAQGVDYFEGAAFRNLHFVRNQVGQPISAFYGYKTVGYFRDADDVQASAKQPGAAPGRFKFADINGDNIIDQNDRTFIGNPNPKFTYGFNVTANYKNFSLEAFLYGKSGNDIVNFSKWYTDFYPSFSGAAIGERALNSWTAENPDGAKTPIFETAANFSTNGEGNSWYIEKGSYARLKNLQLNYTVPSALLGRYGIQRLRVYIQAVNLFTITKYQGKDPEVASSVDTTLGVDVGNYPSTRIYSLGLNLGF